MHSVKGKNVFLSGPITGKPDRNAAQFAVAEVQMYGRGAEDVFDPAMKFARADWTQREYMAACLEELCYMSEPASACGRHIGPKPYYGILVSLPGWQDSEGASIERQVAQAIGMEVCDLEEVGHAR